MRQERSYYVYIRGSFSGTLYIGETGRLRRRVWQHKQHAIEGFTAKYDVTRLLYYEVFHEVLNAIAREKQLKGWRRAKKIALIEKRNPKWLDLSLAWYESESRPPAAKGVLRLCCLWSRRSG
jgi:putative endonuclease